MDTNELIQKLEKLVPRAVLEFKPFGRSESQAVWIELGALLKVAQALKEDQSFRMDWLENLSAHEADGALVLTYFVRSSITGRSLFLRGTLVFENSTSEIPFVSVSSIWPMAKPFEREISELFGVRFEGSEKEGKELLPNQWSGYPLRKEYKFPTEFGSIAHERTKIGFEP